MELLPPISASLGAMVSLAGKLDALELDTELRDEVKKLKSRLLQLSKAQDPPATVSMWMNDVRELSYDMDNCVDAGEDLMDQMAGFKALVKEANSRYDRYIPDSILPIPTYADAANHQLLTVDGGDRRRRDLVVGLYGTGGPVDRLSQRLTDGDDQLKVLSILGVGGIGKTTLAKQLWRKHKPGDHFHCRAFVRTAKKPDMRRILRSILAQVRPHQPPDANEVHDLIHELNAHLKDKRYLLIIDDLWATSVWDVASCAFPEGNHGSRIITTTEVEDVALACCSYQSTCIFQMAPLSDSQSKELFSSAVFRSKEQYSPLLEEITDEIIRRCAGLPQAIKSISSVLASQRGANAVQNREQIRNSLPTNTPPDDMLKQILNVCYNCLPSGLQTCLLYLSLFPENYTILKADIMKQWVAEGFILAPTENDKMKVAQNYFDKLVDMGMIQQIDVDYSDEVLYYAVHHTVHDLITSKSAEENFVTVIDYSQSTVGFSNKVTRLSLQFGSAAYASTPESIGLSPVRSLAFIGLESCFPPISEFKLLRFLILHMWDDQPSTSIDLKPTSELVLLRSLQVTCNDTVQLPDLTHGLTHLETLEINARVASIPANIVHLRSWLHLRLGVGIEMPDVTGILKHANLDSPILLDESSSPPNSVKTVQLFQPLCRIPKWIGQLTNLCILKFVVRKIQIDDINSLQTLPLTFLSLHVQSRTTGLIGFAAGAFTALESLEFRCGVLRLLFQKGTMPNLQRLMLGFNAHRGEQYGCSLLGVEDLSNVQEISAIIGLATDDQKDGFEAAESEFMKNFRNDPSIVSVKRGDMVEEDVLAQEHNVIREKDASSNWPATPKQGYEEDVKQNTGSYSQLIQRAKAAISEPVEDTELMVNTADLMHLRRVVEEKDGGPAWIPMMDRSLPTFSYQAWRRDMEEGQTQYRSQTIFEDASPDVVRDFFWDDDFRMKNTWDDMLLQHETLAECTKTGTMVVRWVRKFPFFCSDREYIIGRRIWASGKTYYCVTKSVPRPSFPRSIKPRRVNLYYSSWCIRPVESRNGDGAMTACEVRLFHHEDMGIPPEIAKIGVRQGMWGCVKRIEPGLRAYQAARTAGKTMLKHATITQADTNFVADELNNEPGCSSSGNNALAEKAEHWTGYLPKVFLIGVAVAIGLSFVVAIGLSFGAKNRRW